MKTRFIRKPERQDLIPQDEFIIEKVIVLDKKDFDKFLNHPLDDYDFIKENVELMYCDKENVYHCILVTSNEDDFGILIESEGYHYARYAAYISKAELRSE
ncbi:MAG: hypothetical protein A2Y45_01470 [Tenericutes bacterium GWC2_34_14]|nr:MAG: hypothetical protein A2Z84_03530 [Tenericutes bacterium GWA2_35_7]OHE28208.1 MAG: hypothetical protein A2Y45_01470 [Tenericutes bacterium GWC2_34_14]OHE33166.1 MAG: hypothetical protein A2012_00610 [Tenericutes bacterium GWE2_34_108]OHE36286.1 MAG: hypothetical protein A2Y46_07600 [Tenericutes bacterium GWF1_35_14]OHE38672.1 MAG: hypothetical protein A2Y44_04630 [Tenericutes bacterium GWF2_35_184]OHE44829.1 MAG: hypothetical protein A2221_01265 [Tenericutes bacterium RIFOXYA2_FULL_36_3